jgi:hypothetical protein
MDEMNPAFENFLNNMSRLGGTPRETTRKVSPAKFLGTDVIAAQVAINSRKITILKNVIQARRVSTGSMLASLSAGSVGVTKEIMDIKETMSSILATLIAQEKFEMRKFLDTQRREENARRRGRETDLEQERPNIIERGVDKVLQPVRNIFSRIIGFFTKLFLGRILIKFLDFFSNPRNAGILNFIAGFISTVFPVILTGAAVFAIAVKGLIPLISGATALLLRAAQISGGVGFLGNTALIARATGLQNLLKRVKGARVTKSARRFREGAGEVLRTLFVRRSSGGVVPGSGSNDTVPAMLTPGEVVISKPAVDKFGLSNLLAINAAAGAKSKPKYRGGRFYANEGGEVKDYRFTPSFMDRVYTETSGSLEDGTYKSTSRIMSLDETQSKLADAYKGMGMDILPGQFLPNVGGKVVNKASEISNQFAPGSFEKVMNQTGMSKEDVQFDSINQKSAKFKPKDKGNSLINLAPVTSNMMGETEDAGLGSFNQLNNQDDTDSSFDNELFDISLEKADSSKMQTLGMMP